MNEEKRIALMGIMIDDAEAVERVNALLHEHADGILGRMGLPIRERGVSVISVVLDQTNERISALSGALGRIEGVSVKVSYSKK